MTRNKNAIKIGILAGIIGFVLTFVFIKIDLFNYLKSIEIFKPAEEITPNGAIIEEWQPMVEKISIWQNGKEQIISPEGSDYIKIDRVLLPTLHKLNLHATCVFSEERMSEIVKRKNKVVEMVFKQADDFPISQWIELKDRNYIKTDEKGYRILENLKSAIFVLGDNLAERPEAYILVGTEIKNRDERCFWEITREDLEELGLHCSAIVGYYYGPAIIGMLSDEYECNPVAGCEYDSEIVPFKTYKECEFTCNRRWGCWAIKEGGGNELDKSWIEEINKILEE